MILEQAYGAVFQGRRYFGGGFAVTVSAAPIPLGVEAFTAKSRQFAFDADEIAFSMTAHSRHFSFTAKEAGR